MCTAHSELEFRHAEAAAFARAPYRPPESPSPSPTPSLGGPRPPPPQLHTLAPHKPKINTGPPPLVSQPHKPPHQQHQQQQQPKGSSVWGTTLHSTTTNGATAAATPAIGFPPLKPSPSRAATMSETMAPVDDDNEEDNNNGHRHGQTGQYGHTNRGEGGGAGRSRGGGGVMAVGGGAVEGTQQRLGQEGAVAGVGDGYGSAAPIYLDYQPASDGQRQYTHPPTADGREYPASPPPSQGYPRCAQEGEVYVNQAGEVDIYMPPDYVDDGQQGSSYVEEDYVQGQEGDGVGVGVGVGMGLNGEEDNAPVAVNGTGEFVELLRQKVQEASRYANHL